MVTVDWHGWLQLIADMIGKDHVLTDSIVGSPLQAIAFNAHSKYLYVHLKWALPVKLERVVHPTKRFFNADVHFAFFTVHFVSFIYN